MIPRLRSNLPLFEAAVIASLFGIGWALLHVYGTLGDLAQRPPPTVPRPEARQVARLTSLVAMREQYLVLADQVTTGLRSLRVTLENYERDRSGAIVQFIREREHLQRQLNKSGQILASGAARLGPGELVNLLQLNPDSADAADLRPARLVSQLGAATSNYLAALNISESTPLSPDIIRRKLQQAGEEETAALTLAADARACAGRIDSLLERHAVDLVTPPGSPLRSDDLAGEFQSASEVTLRLLAGVFLLLAIVLIVSIYRRVVVVPLHHRMIESSALAEYQRKLDHFARVATGLAHEIRNPLTAIGIRLFTLQKSLPPGGPQHADTLLIRAEIDRLEQIVKNFLRLARPSEPRLVRLSARPMLDETRSLLADQCRQQGTELRVESVTNTEFPGDSAQLKQVLINLVQNAAESVGGSGSVTLRAYDDEDQGPDRQGPRRPVVVLEVADTGGGIPPEIQERLFDPFFSTKENGTGLGLPIAAKIVDQHSGRVEFESRPGEGATFRVILPTVSQKTLHG